MDRVQWSLIIHTVHVLGFILRFFVFLTGVRYYMRGLDEDGNVANYVETEQILKFRGYRASFVQVKILFDYLILRVHSVD